MCILFLIVSGGLIFIMGCNPLIYILGDGPDSPSISDKEKGIAVSKREKYIVEHQELTERQKNLISSGIVGEGLTQEQIIKILDWHEPDKKEITDKYGADEVWIYKLVGADSDRRLYFKKDILIKME